MSLLFWPMLFLLITGYLLPFSEDATGGNHNLHYLSPEARRSITPFGSITNIPNRHTPLGVADSKEMYTLYVPGAGFLWSDEMVWAQSGPCSEEYEVEGSERVFFEDRFAERYPWIVEVKNPLERKKKTKKSRSKVGVIKSGSEVQIKSWTSNDYLCLIPGERVTSEAGYFPADEGDVEESTQDTKSGRTELQRIRVGNLPTPCDWTIYYDPSDDSGVVFYNSDYSCRLATTFRSLSNEVATNDTVQRTLRSEIEASCTVNANDASSSFHLIDVSPVTNRPSSRKALANHGPSFPQRSWIVVRARNAVSQFRNRFADNSTPMPQLERRNSSSQLNEFFAVTGIVGLHGLMDFLSLFLAPRNCSR
ncbi:hypothetical protein M409DRAFT_23712 [Zasmidium cellare ATCC 36951]|uniref:Protein ROT1 n=1 Tax=Zasmidium cellare ATCC 36951 TaxID=1080233 RepID=A0A6A6CFR2_ZASCE|nr:uncharacterized protein M409DRAFT_23712 [Zasmidium cellare ATCC 36951]KAF2165985.1 hypothetical protein M409DRAFT_23712 [Zasmidium cellare ATCC 36951]